MTLCVAWNSGGHIHFASDSRIGFGCNKFTNVGVKVLQIEIKIYEPSDSSKQHEKRILHSSYTYGMCFAGSTSNSFFIKESVSEILSSLQYVPGHTDFSIDNFAKIIFKVFRAISAKVENDTLSVRFLATMLIGGYCPKAKKVRAFEFKPVVKLNSTIYEYKEILSNNDEIVFIGDGKPKATELLEKNYNSKVSSNIALKILRDVIVCEDTKTVGGPIQYGTFCRDKHFPFDVWGVATQDDEGNINYYIKGLDINTDEFAEDYDEFILSNQYIDLISNE